MKKIHITKLWRGAIFCFNGRRSDYRDVVFYHVDFINDKVLHYTDIETHKSYESEIRDRFVFLRS